MKSDIFAYQNEELPSNIILKLKSLSTNEYIYHSNSKIIYSYNVIYMAFKSCLSTIKYSISSKTFNDDMHKFNYIVKIVKPRIVEIDKKIKNHNRKLKEKERIVDEALYRSLDIDKFQSQYTKKTKEYHNKIFDDIW